MGTAGGRSLPVEPSTGFDAAFLALETETSRPHVAVVLILGQSDRDAGASTGDACAAIRAVVAQRLHREPRLAQRILRAPLGLWRPVWVDDPAVDLDRHVRPGVVRVPGGMRELEALAGETMSRPLDPDRPLWEMVVVAGLTEGRTAVIARLHHAVLDGEAGATAIGALLDLTPGAGASPSPPAAWPAVQEVPAAPGWTLDAPRWRHGAGAFARQLTDSVAAARRGIDAALADGFSLKVTTMTYQDVVHLGLLVAPTLVLDAEEIAALLPDALAALVRGATGEASLEP